MPFLFAANQIPGAGEFGEYGTYTPALTAATTNPNLGTTGTAQGVWHRTGPRKVDVWVRLIFGGTGVSAGSGIYAISQPVPADASLYGEDRWGLGSVYLGDASAAATRQDALIEYITATTVRMRVSGANLVTEASPFAWTANDSIFGFWSYMAEPGT